MTKVTAVTKKTEAPTDLALFTGGASEGLDSRDLVLPTLAVRQNSYKQDYMKKYQAGDIVLRPQDTKVGGEGKPVLVVPISIEKAYRVNVITGNNEAKTIRFESATVDKDLEWEENGQHYRRDRSFIVHVLLREQLTNQTKMLERLQKGEAVDPDDLVMPVRIVLSRGSLNAGKVLNTHFEMSKALNNQSPALMTFELVTAERKNDKGIWFVFEAKKPTNDTKYTPKEALPVANFWTGLLAKSQLSAYTDEEDTVPTTTAEVVDESKARF